ncbi:type II toxin-antitoxin system RatA family toxin [Cellulomonas wangsupingiae]|uniref:SRPBCC family protein n=1 Tax=Cellulomonas wangsupingiae TaxID=2968085 RepID=A0ABY5K2G8_9CELL|nr:SRPBCC family protein [Cellulomonas wangsupingiae]MCC2335415.1 SRPBCC family protein [Cellulomonas wangsupingiae]MCM0640053.1 SRPBCC family protein [Cellulomonas wangsupingiae]UUI64409.1 SRPBCC family protein [Cellulomonas wangsupingiae]
MIVESSVDVPVPPDVAFAVSQTTGATRLRWDPFIRRQSFLDGATVPAKGVRTLTHHRSGLRMVSEYVSYKPPTNVGMKMVEGPWFFAVMAGGWRFTPLPDGGTRAVWRYSFTCRPAWLAPVAERIGRVVLQRDVDRRIAGFARGCADAHVLDAVGRDGSARG